MKKILIVAGGRTNEDFIRNLIATEKPACIIAVDKGAMVLDKLGIVPDYLVGDFDSAEGFVIDNFKRMFAELGKPVIKQFRPEKDDSDTEIGIKTAMSLEPEEIVITGATGTRLDHTMANIDLLMIPLSSGVKASIVDEYNRIYLADSEFTLSRKKVYGKYFSLIAFSEEITGLTIKGAKYEIEDYTLSKGVSLGISNEFSKAKVSVSFKEGILIVFETSDEIHEFA